MANIKLQTILRKIDSTSEYELYRIMKMKDKPRIFVDTPGNFNEEHDDYDNNILLYYKQNMGKDGFITLIKWIKAHPKQIKLLMRTH